MKHLAKRSLSLLLALLLCLSLLPGVSPEAEAATYVYNWGSRGTTATQLSSYADAFYAKNQASYEDWLDLDGGTASNAHQSDLYLELKKLMSSNHKTITSYDATKSMYQYTDCQNGGGKISSFYSGLSIGPAWDGGGTWNREHTWPNSKGLGGSDENDIMMLRPTSIQENSSRGNTAYGRSGSYYDPNSVSGGRYNLHGDVARIVLYVYVRWGNTRIWGSSGVMESLDVLLDWMAEDPVDTWELGRNDAVESITGTRNVFVDYPELAFLLFNQPVPGDMVTPSGKAAEKAFDITATSNNTAWGTVSVSGKNINCAPAAGYRVAGAQVVSGSATLELVGNVVVVSATGDCSIRVDFEKRRDAQLTYSQNGTAVATLDRLQDDVVTLSGHTGTVPEGYTFRGWLPHTLAETDLTPQDLLAPGSQYTITGTTTLYAVYSRLDAEGSGISEHFELFSGQLVEGDYLIVQGGYAMKAAVKSNRLDLVDVVEVDGAIAQPDASIIWHIAPLGDGYWTIYNKASGLYAAATGVKSKAQVVSSLSDLARWTPSGTGTYEFQNKSNAATGVNSLLRRNSTYGFATYGTSTGEANLLYRADSGTTYYTTSTQPAVSYTVTAESSDTVLGTVSVSGSTITATPAYGCEITGYTLVSGEATVTQNGNVFTVVAASDCQITITFGKLPQLRVEFTENGTVADDGTFFVGLEMTLPEPTNAIPQGYTFAGWALSPVHHATQAPAGLLAPGSKLTVAEDTVAVYAVYQDVSYTSLVYAITAEVTDGAMGSVTVEGQRVTVTPRDGYALKDYTLTGYANITRDGNVLTVLANSDCHLQIELEERTTSTIRFLENGTEVDSQEVYAPTSSVTPQFSGQLLKGYTFVGWTFGQYQGQELPETLMADGETFFVTGDTTICALYQADGYTTTMVEIPRIIRLDAEAVGDATSAWVNGREYPIEVVEGVPQVTFAAGVDPTNLVTYTWFIGDESDVHTQYPTGMKLWSVALTNGAYTATRQEALDDLLQYSGCSIRITGKKGIRMITSVNKEQKKALTGKGLSGYTLVEYGTLLGFASNFTTEAPLTLEHPDAKHNYAYKKGVADPIFADKDGLVQYTNVLVGFSNDQCKEDIAMRPYIILQDAQGNQVTIYGGVIHRSIGYIAYQNRSVFKVGSEAYKYVWEIIHHVYGDAYDADYKE